MRSTRSARPPRSNSSPAGRDSLVAPAYLQIPEYHATLGPEVAAVATLAGFPPDPEQQMLLDAAFAVDRQGKSVAFEVVVIAPRQNLKTGFFKQVALGQLFVRDERLVVWSAHEFDTASEALTDLEEMIGGSDQLRKRIRLTQRGKVASHGAVPQIVLKSGARLKFKTRTSGGGRGLSGRKVILDEGYAVQGAQVGALMPILLAQPDPQVYVGSSACRPESAWLWDVVQRGRSGNEPRMVYAEWCAPPPEEACDAGADCAHERGARGCGCDNPDLIHGVHSAIKRGRILVQSVLDLRSSMPPEEYAREVMGWHDEPDEDQAAVDYGRWLDLEDPKSEAEAISAFAVEVSMDRDWTSIGVCGPKTGAPDHAHVELIERRRGTGWVVARCVELDRTHVGAVFAVDGLGPAASLVPDLEEAGLRVVVMGTKDVAQAYAGMADAVTEGTASHGPQPELDDAVAGAKKRPLGDGAFALGRKVSTVDITPFVAVTNAHWAHEHFGFATPSAFVI